MRPDDGIGEAPGGPRQYMTPVGHGAPAPQRGGELAPANWWGEQPRPAGESELNLLTYWRLMLKHRLVVLGAVIACLTVGVAATLLMTPIYTASTTIQIDREAARVLDVEGVTPAEAQVGDEFFQTQYGLLKSESLASRTVDSLGLARDNSFLEAMGSDGESDPAARRKKAVDVLTKNIAVRPVRGSRLVEVSFASPSPQLSARVANGMAENFIESNLERRYESASYARRFLEERLRQVKARLEETEKQLVAYAASQGIVNVAAQPVGTNGGAEQTASQSLTASDLVAMNTALAAAKSERIRAEQKWRQASSANSASLPEVLQNPTIQALSQTRATLQAQYQEKLGVYKPDYPVMQQLTAQIEELDRQIDAQMEVIRSSIRGQYEVAARQEASLEAQVSGLKSGVMDLRDRSIQYNILQREVDTNRTLYDGLLQRYKEVGLAGGVGTNNISVVDRASPPSSPSEPNPLLNLTLSLVIGLVLGALGALVLELLDETIQNPNEVEAKLGIPLLGAVPVLPKGVSVEEMLEDPRSAFNEAYYSVRTALQFSTARGVPPLLLVTSARPSEGKSTTARVIARNFARLNMKVLLVDTDLRNPSQHRFMYTDNSHGLSNVLTGASSLADAVQTSHIPNLFFIPCGPLPPNPAELLSGPRLRAILAEAQEEYDLVVLDGPPVLGLADAPLLAHAVAGIVFVVQASGTKLGQIRGAIQRLAQGGGSKIVGGILTKYDAKKTYGYGAEYAYDHYEYGGAPKLTKHA